jgi:hypothetical protein
MKRSQRTAHAAIWPTLAVGMLMVLALAYIAREQATPTSGAAPAEVAR